MPSPARRRDGEITFCGEFGYSDSQAYMILGAAPIEGRLSGVVDIPNSCSTVSIPTAWAWADPN